MQRQVIGIFIFVLLSVSLVSAGWFDWMTSTGNVVDENLLSNGDFTDGLNHWRLSPQTDADQILVTDNDATTLILQGYAFVLQDVDLRPGKTYKLTATVVGTGEQNPGTQDGKSATKPMMMIQDSDSWEAVAYKQITSYNAKDYTISFTVPENSNRDYHVSLASEIDSKGIATDWSFFDDVTLVEVADTPVEEKGVISVSHEPLEWEYLGSISDVGAVVEIPGVVMGPFSPLDQEVEPGTYKVKVTSITHPNLLIFSEEFTVASGETIEVFANLTPKTVPGNNDTPQINLTSCVDSDGGFNFSSRGTAQNSSTEETDYCRSSTELVEYHCASHLGATDVRTIMSIWKSCDRDGQICFEGACIDEEDISYIPETCSEAISNVKNPTDLLLENGEIFDLVWNDSHEDSDSTHSSAAWRFSEDYYANSRYAYIDLEVREYFDIERVALRLDQMVSYGLCSQREVWIEDDSSHLIYVCRDLGSVAYERRGVSSDEPGEEHNNADVYWFNGNVLFNLYFSTDEYWGCTSYEDCAEMERERTRNQQESIVEVLDTIIDNRPEYVSSPYLDYQTFQVLEYFLSSCPSQIEEEEGDVGSWSCILEPTVCPPHGEQTQTCRRWNENIGDDQEEIRETTLSCNPGICSGCLVPKWFGSSGIGDNRCIPYGHRFEYQVGYGSETQTNIDEERLTVQDAIDEGDEINLSVANWGGTPSAILSIPDWSDDNYYLSEGDSFTVYLDDGDVYGTELKVLEIYYDSVVYENSYVDFQITYTSDGKVVENIDAYCAIDGQVRTQKTRQANGDWAQCQNNYECASNVCSDGECIEVQALAQDVGAFRDFGARLLCRIANPFAGDGYNQCLNGFGLSQ